MKLYGSLKELVAAVFRKDTYEITLRPNQSVTYSGARDVQLPAKDGNAVLVSSGDIVNSDINASAAIAYSKLALSNSIVNADVSSSAAIAYSKLNLASSIVNADISNSAAIADTKLATITTAGKVNVSAITGTLPVANGGTGITSFGTGVATFLGTPSSANLASAVTDETGSGSLVFGTSPTLSSPVVQGDLLLQNSTGAQPTLQLSEDPDNGTNKVIVQAPANLAADYTLTLPADDGTSGQVLSTDGSGVLSWATTLTNPMTTTGDLIVSADNSGTPSRLAVGASGTVLKGGSSPSYSQIVNADVSASAAIAGSKITAATTSAAGVLTLKAPTQTKYTSGSGTYTTPAGVLYIKVRMVGAGGGGTGGQGGGSGGTGGNTTFGSSFLTANGGGGGNATNGNGGAGGTATVGAGAFGFALTGARGQGASAITTVNPGGSGGYSPFGGAGEGDISTTTNSAVANTGSGGAGARANGTYTNGSGGGAGGYLEATVSLPSASYSYAVGAAGTAGTAGTAGSAGGAGGSGVIIIDEYYY